MPSLRPLRSWRKYIIRYSYKFYQYGLREREKKEIKINFGSMKMSALVRSRTKARSTRLAFDSEIFDSNSTHRNENINKTENEIISNKSNRRAGRDDDSLYVDYGVDLKSLLWSSSSVLFCWMACRRRADTQRCGKKSFSRKSWEEKLYSSISNATSQEFIIKLILAGWLGLRPTAAQQQRRHSQCN